MWKRSWIPCAESEHLMNNGDQVRFEDYLARYGSLTYKNKGTSMLPLLRQDRDLFTIVRKSQERCKKYDIVLYKEKQEYILHRIIKVIPDGYIVRGDNTYRKEFRTDEQILGVVAEIIRDGRGIKVTDLGYRLYSVLRNASYPFRYLFIKIRHATGRFLKLFIRKDTE